MFEYLSLLKLASIVSPVIILLTCIVFYSIIRIKIRK